MTRSLPASRRVLLAACVATLLAVVAVVLALHAGVVSISQQAPKRVLALLEQYSYAFLFCIFVLEGAMLLYFAPSESLVPAAVVAVADSGFEYVLVVAVAVFGATLGQTALFLVAKRGKRELLVNTRLIPVTDENVRRFETWFDRWGRLGIPASNTMLFTRGMLTVPAGFADVDTRVFVVLSAVGTLCFETILACIALGVLSVV